MTKDESMLSSFVVRRSSFVDGETMTKYLPAAAAAATGILVGAAIVATRFVIGQTSPAALALLRYLIGFGCLLPALLLSRRARFERRDLLPIGLLGITQFGVVVILLNYALQSMPSGRAALIFATLPLITMLLATTLGYERVTLIKALGVLATIVGVGFVLGEQSMQLSILGNQWLAMQRAVPALPPEVPNGGGQRVRY